MKKLLVGLFAIFICTFAIAHTVEWYVGNSLYQTTTCNSGDNITAPTAPAKYGYTFDGWVLPYTRLEYIESTGTQYIDTGITVNNKTSVQFVGSFTTVASPNGSVYQLFGVDDVYVSPRASMQIGINNNGQWFFSFGNSTQNNGTVADTQEHLFILKQTDNTASLYIDGVIASSSVVNTNFTSGSSFLLFRRFYQSIDFSPCWTWFKLKSFKMYDNGSLVRDLIPARRNTDYAVGMYDTVTDTFFTNQGTGVFITGPEIGNL